MSRRSFGATDRWLATAHGGARFGELTLSRQEIVLSHVICIGAAIFLPALCLLVDAVRALESLQFSSLAHALLVSVVLCACDITYNRRH